MANIKFEIDTAFETGSILVTDPKTGRQKNLKGDIFAKYLSENPTKKYFLKLVQCSPDKDGDVGPYIQFSEDNAVGPCVFNVEPIVNNGGFLVSVSGVFEVKANEDFHLNSLLEQGVDLQFRIMQIQTGEFWHSDLAVHPSFNQSNPAISDFNEMPLVNIIKINF